MKYRFTEPRSGTSAKMPSELDAHCPRHKDLLREHSSDSAALPAVNVADITPLILTYNEAPNIRDTLERLAWAERIVLVDSFSSDETLDIARQFPQVEVFQRRFDHFADQCNFGLSKVTSRWVLSLDADYKCPLELVDELATLDGECAAYRARLDYGVFGRVLRSSLYPPRVVLYQAERAKYRRDGHAHRVCVAGKVGELQTPILHDDQKPLSVWLDAQLRYAREEAAKLSETSWRRLCWKDRIRLSCVVAPLAMLPYCLFGKLLILDGVRGIYYTLQRVYSETLLAVVLLDQKLRGARPPIVTRARVESTADDVSDERLDEAPSALAG